MMILSEYKLVEGNHFVAMEYYGLFLNRTFLILLTEQYMVGVVANGLVSVTGNADPLTTIITNRLAIHGDLHNPLSYLNEKYLRRVGDLDLLSDGFLRTNRAHFRINIDDISEVTYNPRKKWGMGYYPHDGKVYVTMGGKKREFIILGDQSGRVIAGWIQGKSFGNGSASANPAHNADAAR
jgi:hypothetical protein